MSRNVQTTGEVIVIDEAHIVGAQPQTLSKKENDSMDSYPGIKKSTSVKKNRVRHRIHSRTGSMQLKIEERSCMND